MSASERAIGELFSAVDSLLRCFYGEDTSRAWIDSRYTPTPITCKNCVAGVAGVAGVAAALDDFPDDGFSGDVGVTCVTGGGNYDRHDECVDISLSYRDTDTGRQVNADDLPEPTSLERRLYKQRYRPQVSLSLYETCLADRRRFVCILLYSGNLTGVQTIIIIFTIYFIVSSVYILSNIYVNIIIEYILAIKSSILETLIFNKYSS